MNKKEQIEHLREDVLQLVRCVRYLKDMIGENGNNVWLCSRIDETIEEVETRGYFDSSTSRKSHNRG